MGFTAKQIENLKPKDKPYQIREGKGFGVRVFPSGEKTWVFAYKFHGSQRMMTLGPYPEFTLANARQKFQDARELMKKGIDPLAVKHNERMDPTGADMIADFLKRHVKEKAPRSLDEYQRNLEKDVLPAWKRIKVKDITRRDVQSLLDKIVDRGAKNQANQVFKIVRAMFNWAVPYYDLEHSPCGHVKLPTKENKKERFFTEEEIHTFWQELDNSGMTDPMKGAFQLILVTGQRPGEVIGLHSREIEGNWWTIPAERAKNKKEHHVFLSPLALAILAELPEEGFLFPSPRGGKPIEVNALAHAVRRNSAWGRKDQEKPKKKAKETKDQHEPFAFSINEPWTPHDLRRTCATNLGKAGYSDEVIGRILNHTRAGVTSRYNRHQYDKEIQQALTAWGRKLESIVTGQKVDAKVINLTR